MCCIDRHRPSHRFFFQKSNMYRNTSYLPSVLLSVKEKTSQLCSSTVVSFAKCICVVQSHELFVSHWYAYVGDVQILMRPIRCLFGIFSVLVSLCVCLFFSVFVCRSVSVSVCLFLSLSVGLCLSLSLTACVCVCVLSLIHI